ncbi:hypothetical protein MRB53_037882 [Persea americana]|nr:hypothetical protein MRB53_037882 [Persea americana]
MALGEARSAELCCRSLAKSSRITGARLLSPSRASWRFCSCTGCDPRNLEGTSDERVFVPKFCSPPAQGLFDDAHVFGSDASRTVARMRHPGCLQAQTPPSPSLRRISCMSLGTTRLRCDDLCESKISLRCSPTALKHHWSPPIPTSASAAPEHPAASLSLARSLVKSRAQRRPYLRRLTGTANTLHCPNSEQEYSPNCSHGTSTFLLQPSVDEMSVLIESYAVDITTSTRKGRNIFGKRDSGLSIDVDKASHASAARRVFSNAARLAKLGMTATRPRQGMDDLETSPDVAQTLSFGPERADVPLSPVEEVLVASGRVAAARRLKRYGRPHSELPLQDFWQSDGINASRSHTPVNSNNGHGNAPGRVPTAEAPSKDIASPDRSARRTGEDFLRHLRPRERKPLPFRRQQQEQTSSPGHMPQSTFHHESSDLTCVQVDPVSASSSVYSSRPPSRQQSQASYLSKRLPDLPEQASPATPSKSSSVAPLKSPIYLRSPTSMKSIRLLRREKSSNFGSGESDSDFDGRQSQWSSGSSQTSFDIATPFDIPSRAFRSLKKTKSSLHISDVDAMSAHGQHGQSATFTVIGSPGLPDHALSYPSTSLSPLLLRQDDAHDEGRAASSSRLADTTSDATDGHGLGISIAAGSMKASTAHVEDKQSRPYTPPKVTRLLRNFSRPANPDPSDLDQASPAREQEVETIKIWSTQTERDQAAIACRETPRGHHKRASLASVTSPQDANINADAAEAMLLNIMTRFDTFPDLFAAARTNQGFYSVFRRRRLQLIKQTLYNRSPAAWELRESSPKQIVARLERLNSDYTPQSYVQFHTRDSYTLAALKSLIATRCLKQLRPETIIALNAKDTPRAHQIDDALWRIWAFCTIFGSESGREHDLAAQMDWLRGGKTSRAERRPSTSVPSTPFRMRHGGSMDVLGRPGTAPHGSRTSEARSRWFVSESFGKGNGNGLGVPELNDMMELWLCVRTLLSDVRGPGRRRQARRHGLFVDHDIHEKDRVAEQATLDEWTYYLATLGLSTILDLATAAALPEDTVFDTARSMKWTQWTSASHGLSYSTFLQEAVFRVHEERLEDIKAALQQRALAEAKSAPELRRRPSQDRVPNSTDDAAVANSATPDLPTPRSRPMSLWVAWTLETANDPLRPAPTTPLPTIPAFSPLTKATSTPLLQATIDCDAGRTTPISSTRRPRSRRRPASQTPLSPSTPMSPTPRPGSRSRSRVARKSSGTLSLFPPEYMANAAAASGNSAPPSGLATPRTSPLESPHRSPRLSRQSSAATITADAAATPVLSQGASTESMKRLRSSSRGWAAPVGKESEIPEGVEEVAATC